MEDKSGPTSSELERIISKLKTPDSGASEPAADPGKLEEADKKAEDTLHRLYEGQEKQNSSE